MLNYHDYTSYTRYVDFKRLDFIIRTVAAHCSPNNNIRGLDIGCGEGNITIPFAALGYQITGVDISPEVIKKAESKRIQFPNLQDFPEFMVGNIGSLTIESEHFDFIICSEVLEHLRHPAKASNLIHRILKKGGILIVTVPNGYGLYCWIYDRFRNRIASKIVPKLGRSEHIQWFTVGQIQRLLDHAKFKFIWLQNSDFISFLPFLNRSKKFCEWDCKLADKLPSWLISGWYLTYRKE